MRILKVGEVTFSPLFLFFSLYLRNQKSTAMKFILKFFSIILIKYLQKRYKKISIKNRYNQSNRVLNKLILIQNLLYFFKEEFSAWGYFHPSCGWSKKDEAKFRKLFPEKEDFEELDIVVWHNPGAVTYYHNKIFNLQNRASCLYSKEIKKQLKEWKKWN